MKLFTLPITMGLILGLGLCQPIWAITCYDILAGRYDSESQIQLSQAMRSETFSDRVFDADGDVRKHLAQILLEYRLHGQIHVTNTGLANRESLLQMLPEIGFTSERKFTWGGRASLGTQNKWVEGDVLRNLDYYPPHLYLLPNTEVQYSKIAPKDVLFFVEAPHVAGSGGRMFTHDIKNLEYSIATQPGGQELLDKIRAQGLTIVTGYVDDTHPERKKNYFKSWQELSGFLDIDAAISELKKRKVDYDRVWKQTDSTGSTYTLMTKISIAGFRNEFGEEYLNLPRIAVSQPSFENGYRQFLFGNGDEFTSAQINILLKAYLATREGSVSKKGDLFIMNNMRVAHSRESFDPKNNSHAFLVGMSGVRFDDRVPSDQQAEIKDQFGLIEPQFIPLWNSARLPSSELPKGVDTKKSGGVRYLTPPIEDQFKERFSMQIYDLAGRDLTDPVVQAEINSEYAKYGHLHIINNHKYTDSLPESVLASLGFAPDEQFQWGGTNSGRTVRTPLGSGFHTVDKFPSQMPLLAHNEILYQRVLPLKMLFHYRQVSGEGYGGRTFVHSAQNMELLVRESGEVGEVLLKKLKKYGQLIRTGFLDQNHPDKEQNYVRSWQDRFGTTDIDVAVKICSEQRTHFDHCWKKVLAATDAKGQPTYMLMTEVTIPMFKHDSRNDKSYMMFPRIAYDNPSIINGFREFIIGNGEDFTVREREILIKASWQTREGVYQNPGDIILLDNMRYGHSREPYSEVDAQGKPLSRKAAVIMAGQFYTDDYERVQR